MQMRQRDVAALDAKYTKELADAAGNDALRDDVAAGRRRLHTSSLSVMREATTASGVDNAASPRLADTAERDYFTLRERLITMQKQLEGTQKYINEQCRYCPYIDGQLMQLLWAIHTRFQRSINAQSNKTEQSIYVMFAGFLLLTTFSAPPQILAASIQALPNSRNEEMMGDGFGATAAGLFWTVNVCWAHPVISRELCAVASSIFFHGVIPDAFWSSQNRMCRKLNKP